MTLRSTKEWRRLDLFVFFAANHSPAPAAVFALFSAHVCYHCFLQEPYYVRCIKPNATKSGGDFDNDLVVHQVGALSLSDCVFLASDFYGSEPVVNTHWPKATLYFEVSCLYLEIQSQRRTFFFGEGSCRGASAIILQFHASVLRMDLPVLA